MIHISKLGSEIITFVCLFQPFWMDFQSQRAFEVVLKVVLLCCPDQIGSISMPVLQIGKRNLFKPFTNARQLFLGRCCRLAGGEFEQNLHQKLISNPTNWRRLWAEHLRKLIVECL